jgi:hypothetical protein
MKFAALEAIMFEHCNGVLTIELSAAEDLLYAVLSDSDGEIINSSGGNFDELFDNVEKDCQLFCDDYDIAY